MAAGPLRKAVDRSVSARVRSGTVDPETDAAVIAMLRFMADAIDANGADALRSVTPASYLSFCKALGIASDEAPRVPAKPDRPATIIDGGSRFASRRAADG